MKLIKIFHNLETQFHTLLQNNETIRKSLLPVGALCVAAAAIWVIGPLLSWNDISPLAQPEKRIYAILFVFLAWLLKFLIIDLDASPSKQQNQTPVHNKFRELQSRFQGATKFLNTTTIPRHNKPTYLSGLPWYLLIGPANAGKTTLLAHSGVHFILQKQIPNQVIGTSGNCDWWVTREASIIDVPGRYLSLHDGVNHTLQANTLYSKLWLFFLQLIKKHHGRKGVNGIIIALPAPDIIKQTDNKNYQALLRDTFQRLNEIQQMFPHPVSCQVIITKCDLLPGFTEFFAESSNEETNQAWGVTLPAPSEGEKITDLFAVRFNALIKKINQQLLWRLHQERNPMARPYIKDFPLQVERIKEFTLEFIKKLSAAHSKVIVQGVYLTSALQPKVDVEENIIEQTANTTSRAVQIFKEPAPASRAYFIKNFIMQGIGYTQVEYTPSLHLNQWKRRAAYAASIIMVAITVIMLGKDFQQGVTQSYLLQKNLSEYEFKVAQIQDPLQHLVVTVQLLNTLQESLGNPGFKMNLSYLLSYYSHKSQQKAHEAYQHALRVILLPEIKRYFETFLDIPVNQNAEDIYAVLKAYLMMGDVTYFDAGHVSSTLGKILPKSLSEDANQALVHHLRTALTSPWTPLELDVRTIAETRRFLTKLPELKLGYIILKNLDGNDTASEMIIESNSELTSLFGSEKIIAQIPAMFTAKSFNSILSQETILAAQQTVSGNWVLGNNANQNIAFTAPLVEQIRTAYINNYIEVWENLLAKLHLTNPADLAQTDAMIVSIISSNSPLLHLLQVLHDNTNFEPILTASAKLQKLDALIDKNADSQKTLYEIFASLQSLHQYLQIVLNAENEKQAAFSVVSSRMLGRGSLDAITQLRLIAEKSPDPLKHWLTKITNDSWTYLMQESGQYLDMSWQNQVVHPYQEDIAGRYPFSTAADKEVNMQKFIRFFGNSGIVLSFYNKYLQPFVDTSTADWHWKKISGQTSPFSEETLRQIQHATRIHHAFFPKGDDKLYVQFALQPYEFGKLIKSVRLNINDNQFTDDSDSKESHSIIWPSNHISKTSVQFTLADQQTINRNFPGNWGWFKLVNQSFESVLTKKEILLNLSMNENPAKYILSTEGRYNPFMSLNLQHFHLPQQVTDERTYA